VIHDVTLSIAPGEAVGLVGESGSGKSMTARAIMGLLPRGARVGGDVWVQGRSVREMSPRALRDFRQRAIGMVYQDPKAHINPLRTVGDFLSEGLRETRELPAAEIRARTVGALEEVGIADAGRRLRQYPHELSGGLLQRVMIASVLLVEPKLMLADEPTTALDVTTQQEVMAIVDEQRRERSLALLFITHDLDLAIAITDRIAVMYAGTLVETAPASDLHISALHPYTRALLDSRPSIRRTARLNTIPGRPISAHEAGSGCVFASRCPFVEQRCRTLRPTVRPLDAHLVACHRAEELRPQPIPSQPVTA
jgi:oligopeptide/dipeptide ABC transporter ATP-binding protein